MKTLSATAVAAVLALCAPFAAGTRRRVPGSTAGNASAHHDQHINMTMRLWRHWAHLHASQSRRNSSGAIPSSEEVYGEPLGGGEPLEPSWEEEMTLGPDGEIPYEGSGCEAYCEDMKKEGVLQSELCEIPPCKKCGGCAKLKAATAPHLQVGLIKVGGWKPRVAVVQKFKFGKAFVHKVPVVVITANTRGPDPASIRVKDVTKEGFSAVITEPVGNDGPHADMDVPYMAVEPGIHKLPGGNVMEVGFLTTASEVQAWRCKHKGPLQQWDTLKFKTKFKKPPAFVTTIQTMANEKNGVPRKPSNPFLAVTTKRLTGQGVQVSLERAEMGKTRKLTKKETIGYVAMTAGTGSLALPGGKFVSYAAVLSRDNVKGWGGRNHKPITKTVAFGKDLGAKPLVIASQATRDGGDGGWVRIASVNSKGAKVVIDEDKFCDRERSHTTERVALIAWSRACSI